MLFKILHGDASRISTEITPFHEGYCYVTHQGHMYIDMNLGTAESPNNQRVKLNANQAESILGYSISTVLNSSDIEIPTSSAVVSALADYVKTSDIESYIFNIDYDSLLAFDTSEVVFSSGTTSILGQAILGKMILA